MNRILDLRDLSLEANVNVMLVRAGLLVGRAPENVLAECVSSPVASVGALSWLELNRRARLEEG